MKEYKISISYKRRWKINELFYYFMILFFEVVMIYPDAMTYMAGYNYIRIMQNVLAIIIIIMSMFFIKENKVLLIVLLLYSSYFLATFINHAYYPRVWYYFSKSYTLIVFLHMLGKRDKEIVLTALADYFAIIVYVNTLFTLLKPTGLIYSTNINNIEKGIYLLGEKNQVMPYFLIAMTLSIAYSEIYKYKKYRCYFIFACAQHAERRLRLGLLRN